MAADAQLATATGVNALAGCDSPPMVNLPQEICRTFTRSGMDVPILGDHGIEKTGGMRSGS
jgi:hypothetical protein